MQSKKKLGVLMEWIFSISSWGVAVRHCSKLGMQADSVQAVLFQ